MKRSTILLLFLIIGCQRTTHKIQAQLFIDSQQLNITNGFHLLFYDASKTYDAHITGDNVIIPSFPKDIKSLNVKFVYNDTILTFNNIDINELKADQDMIWRFKVLTKNFEEVSTSFEDTKIKRLNCWEFDPIEHGEGVVITQPIYQ